MAQPFSQGFKTRLALIIFLKNSSVPVVLYVNNPEEEYKNFKEMLKSANAIPKLIEKETAGPVKKISFMSNLVCGVALQEEQVPS